MRLRLLRLKTCTRLESIQRLEGEVQLRRLLQFGKVRHQKLARLRDGRRERLERKLLRLLVLRHDAAALIGRVVARVLLQLERMRLHGKEHHGIT